MHIDMQYKDLTHAIRMLRRQVIKSIPYAIENFPSMNSPEQIFKFLKLRTTYKKDPTNRELFQSLPTLLENNWHGIPGAGDCDCFTIAALATLIANGFTDVGIYLVGRSPFKAVHIYAYVVDKGKHIVFDLTNRVYGYERHYPYKQTIPFKLNQNEKTMLLTLADGPGSTPGYIHFPNKGVKVREDYFDHLSAGAFQNMCLSEGIDIDTLEELSGKRFDRRMEKKAKKAAVKNTAKANKPRNIRKTEKLAIKDKKTDYKGQAKILNKQAKILKNTPTPQAPEPYYAQPQELPYSPQDAYNNPEEATYQEPEVYYEEPVYSEEEQYEQEMSEMFEGELSIGGMTVGKGLLWGLGILTVGTIAGYALKTKQTRKRAA